MIVNSIISEYKRYKLLAEKTVQQVSDEQLTIVLGEENNSISILFGHIAGNLKSRFTDFLNSDGEKSWRNRDLEFEPRFTSRTEMLATWDESWSILFDTLDSLKDDDLHKIVTIRRVELSVTEALHRSLAHLSYHVGQIVLLGRNVVGEKWQSLSIPRGKSAQYNANPTKEKG
ncbi:MAG: DUF1572 family protein [Deferribacteres bacterium]|nr:DUF1572 family protein [candidate division KSB1 bacterium]MCB9503911.1 DUF1572 family protein [Deferribacteres bacterium]